MTHLIKVERIAPMIHLVRGDKVILDRDLAALYGVENRALKQAVRRNPARFPSDFMFELIPEEAETLVSQNVIPSKQSLGGAMPMAFTEQGVAMLSSVLRSQRATEVNIAIMRTFVQLRSLMDSNRDLAQKINTLEKKYDEQFAVVFKAIKELITENAKQKQLEQQNSKPKRRIGFKQDDHS